MMIDGYPEYNNKGGNGHHLLWIPYSIFPTVTAYKRYSKQEERDYRIKHYTFLGRPLCLSTIFSSSGVACKLCDSSTQILPFPKST